MLDETNELYFQTYFNTRLQSLSELQESNRKEAAAMLLVELLPLPLHALQHVPLIDAESSILKSIPNWQARLLQKFLKD